jgi:hypothetical protein
MLRSLDGVIASASGTGANFSMLAIGPEYLSKREPREDSRALGHLYGRKWFGRLGTFHEGVLSVDLLLVCGQKITGRERLAVLAKQLSRLRLYEFYNLPPVFVLRLADGGCLLQGDAFLHGVMELSETRQGSRGG